MKAGRASSSTRSSASTPPARRTTTATAASCSTCCGTCARPDPADAARHDGPSLLRERRAVARSAARVGHTGAHVPRLTSPPRSGPAPPPAVPSRSVLTDVVAWALILGAVVGFGWLITHPLGPRRGPLRQPDLALVRGGAHADAEHARRRRHVPRRDRRRDGRRRRWPRSGSRCGSARCAPAVFLALVTAGVGGFYFVATHVDPRQRPPVRILDPGLVPDHSFPSGHVGTATAVYGAIVVLVWAYARRSRSWAWVLLALPVAGAAGPALPGRPPPHRRADERRLRDRVAAGAGQAAAAGGAGQ